MPVEQVRWSFRRLVGLALVAGLFYPLPGSAVQAQGIGWAEQTETNINAYYRYFRPGAMTIRVHVVGAVASPGLYEVGEGTDLGTLLTLSRPQWGVQQGASRVGATQRDVTIRLFRQQSNSRMLLYEASFDHALAHPEEHPVLSNEDVLTVEATERARIGWRDVLQVAQAIAVFSWAIIRLGNAL